MAEILGVRLEKVVTTDAFQKVWQGTAAGKRFAVHVLDEALRGTPSAETFRDGARRLFEFRATGGHRGVEQVHAVADDGAAFVADLWTLGSMADVSALRWDTRRRVTLFRELVEALAALHGAGIVHGCLRPSNVVFDDDLRPVLTDVGLVDIALTLSGDERGAHGFGPYASPEARYGMPVDARADVFSAGKLLHFLLQDATPPEVTEPLPRLDAIAETAPPGLVRIVRKCVHPEPASRYASMDALRVELGRWEEPASVGLGHPEVPETGGPAPDATGDRLTMDRAALRDLRSAAEAPAASARASSLPRPSQAVRSSVTAGPVSNAPASAHGASARPPTTGRTRPPGARKSEGRASTMPPGTLPGTWSSKPPPAKSPPADPLEGLGTRGRIGLAAGGVALIGLSVVLAMAMDLPGALGALGALGGAIATAAIPTSASRPLAGRAMLAFAAAVLVYTLDLPARASGAAAKRAVGSEDIVARTAAVRALVLRGQRDLDGVQLEGADLHEATLSGASFQGANLRRVDFRGANLLRARLLGADVTGAQFSGACVMGADLRGTALAGATGVEAVLCDAATQWPDGWSCVDGRATPK